MLAALRDGGLRVVTLTNGNADVEATPLAGLVDASVSPALVGSAKPDRAMFEAAAKAGRAMAGSTLHVGDDPEADVRGARRAGMRAILVVPPEHDEGGTCSHAERVRQAADAQLAATEEERADAVVGHAADVVPLLRTLGFGSAGM
ncbi:hypothetical protein FNF31_04815 [Cafeteria roenbergensis]|uniref:Haloacid dehalogenase-like hydrolase domain-containing protein 3 n=1 Tax=Cafeteria roenbergensis TaxID=33653 RepID=A0A5A8D3F7_CAFRO|nr:hypothetical protein FNF28_05911 [Cafeteria roenbergensis]KAA0159449.1 hypothetical protein FNF31_04815 [Cafeteria roenbergensis]